MSMLETDTQMLGWKKLRLALIIIVDGVLIAHMQISHSTPKYVNMVKDLKTFFKFSWERESFLKPIKCMKPRSFSLQGFPLALQLLAFRLIHALLSKIPASFDEITIMNLEDGYLPQHPSINLIDTLRVEFDPNVSYFHIKLTIKTLFM